MVVRTLETEPKHVISLLNEKWEKAEQLIAMSSSGGKHKSLTTVATFNGLGASVVRFYVKGNDYETEFEQFDNAAEAYNDLLP